MRSLTRLLLPPLLALCAAAHAAPAEVNSATRAQLESVIGIGPALAQRMLDARERGPFKDWRDLMARVAGVGPASAAKLSEAGLTVDGAAYDGAVAPRVKRARTPR
jgi:competence protein ComEA